MTLASARFVTLEGGEGVGKSTQAGRLTDALRARGLTVVETREPGGSEGAEAIRTLLLGGDEARWNMRAEALLFAAARSDHVARTIRPALARGEWVVCDRFLDSSLAYQGAAGGLDLRAVRELHSFGSEDLLPDRTLLLVADPIECERRCRSRDGLRSDRIGSRGAGFHAAVAMGFADLVRSGELARGPAVECVQPEGNATIAGPLRRGDGRGAGAHTSSSGRRRPTGRVGTVRGAGDGPGAAG